MNNFAIPELKSLYEAVELNRKWVEKFNQDVISANTKFLNKFSIELLEPINEIQKNWILILLGINPVKKPEVRLIRCEDGKIIFEFNGKKMGKKNSQHLLLLKALLHKSDESGFISYEDINKYFIENGLKEIKNKKAFEKRIWLARDAIFRFLGISKMYKGKELIKTIAGKGLQIYNPLM